MTNEFDEDHIADFLKITPINEVTIIEPERVEIVVPENDGHDPEYVRKNLYEIIEKGKESLEEMMTVAKKSGHDKDYSNVITMMRVLSQNNMDLVNLEEKRLSMEQKKTETEKADDPKVINNNLFVTSAELLEQIKKQIKLVEKENNDKA